MWHGQTIKHNENRLGKTRPQGVSLEDLFAMLPDDETARQWLEKNIWPDGRKCPKCGHDDTAPTKNSRMPYRCRGCNKSPSVRTGTAMAHSHASYRNWVITTYLLATRPKGVLGMQMHRDLGIKQSTAWLLLHKLRKSWHTLTGSDPMFGPAGADEAYTGWREKGKHADKGKSDKTAIVGIGDRIPCGPDRYRKPPRPVLSASSGPTSSRAPRCTLTGTGRAATLQTGDLANLVDETVNCGDGECVRGDVRINSTESFWAHVRRVYNKPYAK